MTPQDLELLVAINHSLLRTTFTVYCDLHVRPATFKCSCGFECESIDQLAAHALDHGVFSFAQETV